MMRASRVNSSSILSPERAETSTATGMFDLDAHRDASSGETSRPSGATVAVILVPALGLLIDRNDPPPESNGNGDCLLDVLEGVPGGSCVSLLPQEWMSPFEDPSSESRSVLFPASNTVKFGDARARASIRNVGKAVNEGWEPTSYISIAPAAPR